MDLTKINIQNIIEDFFNTDAGDTFEKIKILIKRRPLHEQLLFILYYDLGKFSEISKLLNVGQRYVSSKIKEIQKEIINKINKEDLYD